MTTHTHKYAVVTETFKSQNEKRERPVVCSDVLIELSNHQSFSAPPQLKKILEGVTAKC